MRSIYRVKEILQSKWGSGAEGGRPQEELTQEADRILKKALSKCTYIAGLGIWILWV
jgi:hypothetical protein